MRLFFFIIIIVFASCKLTSTKNDELNEFWLHKGNLPCTGQLIVQHSSGENYFRQGPHDYLDSLFVIGSVSKQITAVLALQCYDQGLIKLDVPIRKYLPELKDSWADTITVHQLLTHTHGIDSLGKKLFFTPGTSFKYSNIGFDLVAKIVAHVKKKPEDVLFAELFQQCEMTNSYYPSESLRNRIVKFAYLDSLDQPIVDADPIRNYPGAGALMSTAHDLNKWAQALYGGKLLSDSTFQKMITPQPLAVRDHPVFGNTEYGYGVTVTTIGGHLRIGHTGFADGFCSMCYYFPDQEVSVVLLENRAFPDNMVKSFSHHVQFLNIIENWQ